MIDIVLSEERKQRIQKALEVYWLSPFCSGTILLGEPLLSWALNAQMLSSKAYADAYDVNHKIAYQIKTGLVGSPVTFARLTTPSQFQLVNSNIPEAAQILGNELLEWVRDRIEQPKKILGASEVRLSRLIYTLQGKFIYYERVSYLDVYQPEDYFWRWSIRGNALEGYRHGKRWFSWYPQGREKSKNQNQLHFHGENVLMPIEGSTNRFNFQLGKHAQIPFDRMIEVISGLIEETSNKTSEIKRDFGDAVE